MSISARSLFHFTSKAEYLIGILENGFYPRYCLEEAVTKRTIEVAIPMVCFCDLPLSEVSSHIGFYGNYGLGLSKEWAVAKGINPLLYLSKEATISNLIDEIISTLKSYYKDGKKTPKEDELLRDLFNIYEVSNYTKPIKGKMYKNGKFVSKYFYDEREWRYIPEVPLNDKNYRLDKLEFLNPIKLAQANSKIKKTNVLSYDINDIKYIVVEKETDICSMIEAIEDIFRSKDKLSRQLLCSKILTVNQIKEDF